MRERMDEWSDSDDEQAELAVAKPSPAMRGSRMSTDRIQRALNYQPPPASERPSEGMPESGPAARAELSTRISAVERMSQALERRGGPAAAQRFSFQCSTARRPSVASPSGAPSPGLADEGIGIGSIGSNVCTEDERALALTSLGAPAAMERLLSQAAASGVDEAALERAIESLARCESRAAASLHSTVDDLKQSFRARLERLEAAFVAQADAIRDELTRQVRAEKAGRAAEVAEHAEQLCAAMARRAGGGRAEAGASVGGRGGAASVLERGWRPVPVSRVARPAPSPKAQPQLDLRDEREWWGSDEEGG
jgi:hypothetical protein